MILKITVLLFGLIISGNGNDAGGGVMDHVDSGLKYVESMYLNLEHKVEDWYSKLKETIAGTVLSVVEAIDSKVSQAITKIQYLREDCRVPAELSLDNLSRKVKKDFNDCVASQVSTRYVEFYNRSLSLVENVKDSANTSLAAIKSCVGSEYAALRDIDLSNIGTCEFTTGLLVMQRFVEDSSSVQTYVEEVVKFSFNSTVAVTSCFKQELMDSSIEAIISAADKCQARI